MTDTIQRRYWRTGEASKEIGVRPLVIRFWSDELGLQPARNARNERLFSASDMAKLYQVSEMRRLGHGLKWMKGETKERSIKRYDIQNCVCE